MDEKNDGRKAAVEKYLLSLSDPTLTQEKGKQFQDEFIAKCQQDPALELAYLMHPQSGADMNDPAVQRAISGLKAEVAKRESPPVDPVRSREQSQ